jgi:hypothetical protein
MTLSRRHLLLPIVAVSLSGCAARLNQFNTFAQAGVTYTTASQTLLTEAGNAAVNADSALLIHHRSELSEAQRRARITASDTALRQRLEILQLIRAHGNTLAAYFQALSALADPKAGDSVGTAAQNFYNALAKLSPELKNAKVGSTTVSSFIPTVIAPAVAVFKVKALDNELHLRAKPIADELALQQAAFNALASEFKTDAQELQNLHETDSINQFASAAALPSDWANQRPGLLSTPAPIASINAAAKAADQLGKAWAALVANKLDSNGFNLLMTDISNLLAIVQTIESATR